MWHVVLALVMAIPWSVVAFAPVFAAQGQPGLRCTVVGTSGHDVWVVRRRPSGRREVRPHAVICGGRGDDRIRTPETPFRGIFVGGPGDDAVGRLSRGARFRGGLGHDRITAMRGGRFEAGPGNDVVTRYRRGLLVAGEGRDEAGNAALARARDEVDSGSAGRPRLLEVRSLRWSDTSLGCPQPGRAYPQVVTPGYRAVFMADGRASVVHADRAGRVVVVDPSSCPAPTD